MITLRFLDTLPTAVVDELQSLVAQIRGFLSVAHNEDGTIIGSNPMLNVVPIGLPAPWLTATAPTGWVMLDGAQKNRVTYKALYELWGTTFGVGDGSTTFNVPDFRGKFYLGKATSGTGSTIGETGGTLDHTHSGGTFTGATGATTPTISGSTAGATATISGSTGSTSPGTSSYSLDLTDLEVQSGTGSFVLDKLNGAEGGSTIGHSHTVTSHSHSAGTLAVDSHAHGIGSLAVSSHTHSAGTLALSASGSANPAYIAGNWIAYAGV